MAAVVEILLTLGLELAFDLAGLAVGRVRLTVFLVLLAVAIVAWVQLG